LRAVLIVDTAFEFLVGLLLLVFRDEFADGLDVASGAVAVAAVVFLGAGVALLGILFRPTTGLVRLVALLNIAAGLALWLVLALRWGSFEADSRWFTTAVANTFLALGALEWLGIRRA